MIKAENPAGRPPGSRIKATILAETLFQSKAEAIIRMAIDNAKAGDVTARDIREHGVRLLLIYCTEGLYCYHSAVIDADRWHDDTVLLDLDPRLVCTKCGHHRRAGSAKLG
jgi:hypothetical protein